MSLTTPRTTAQSPICAFFPASSREEAPTSMNREIGSLPASAKSTPCAPEASTTWLAWVILGLTPPTVATRRKPSSR